MDLVDEVGSEFDLACLCSVVDAGDGLGKISVTSSSASLENTSYRLSCLFNGVWLEKCDSMVSKDWDKLFFIILSLSSEGGDDEEEAKDEVVFECKIAFSSSATGLIL